MNGAPTGVTVCVEGREPDPGAVRAERASGVLGAGLSLDSFPLEKPTLLAMTWADGLGNMTPPDAWWAQAPSSS